jgi:hypothetical protein
LCRERGLRAIEQAVMRLERLRRDLLDLAVLGTDRFILRRERTDLMLLLGELVGAYQTLSPDHALRLQGPESVWGQWDQGRLARVIRNLLANALNYSPDGGEVRVLHVGRKCGEGPTRSGPCDPAVGRDASYQTSSAPLRASRHSDMMMESFPLFQHLQVAPRGLTSKAWS